jgi:hypothetical protein
VSFFKATGFKSAVGRNVMGRHVVTGCFYDRGL